MLDSKFQSLFLSESILAIDYVHWKHITQIMVMAIPDALVNNERN